MYKLERFSKENISPLRLKIYIPPTQIKQTLYTQPGVSYAQIIKQNLYTPAALEEVPKTIQRQQQNSDIQELKKR
jgi:hypothetical protein